MFLTFGRSFEGQDKVKGQKESRIWKLIFKTINHKKQFAVTKSGRWENAFQLLEVGERGQKNVGGGKIESKQCGR